MAIDAAKLMVMVAADTGPAEKGLQSFSGKMGSLAGGMGAIGAGMSLAITAPLVGIATSALTMAADFEKSMNVLEEVTGAPGEAMASLQAQALQLGKDTIFSANEAAEAMLELGKAGMDTAEIGDSIAGVMNFAAAGEIGLAEAANLTTAALNSFGLEASEATRIADLYAAAANASTASMTDLAQGGKAAGFAFKAAGMPVEDMVTSLAILTNNGLTGSDAGTALKNMLVQLSSPTKKAAKIMKELGIDVFDVNGNMLAMPDIIEEFRTGMEGLTMEERNADLTNILLSDGMKAMIPLLDTGVAGFNDMKAAVTEQGVAARIADALTKGLGGAMEYLSGSVATFLTGAALPFLDMIGGWVRGVADMITGIGNLPGPVLAAAGAFLAVLAAAGPVIAVIAGVAGAFALLGGAVAGPIFLIVGAVAALAAAFAADFGGIQGIVSGVVSAVGAAFTTLSNYFRIVISDGDTLNDWLTHMPASVQPVAQAVGKVIVAFQNASAQVKNWSAMIGTVGVASESFLIATQELPDLFGMIARGISGMAASIKLFAGMATTDLGIENFQALSTVINQVFGETTGKQIELMATRVQKFVQEMQAAKPAEWFGTATDFAADMGGMLSTAVKGMDWAGVRGQIVAALGLDKIKIDTTTLVGTLDTLGLKLGEALSQMGLGTLNFDKLAGMVEAKLIQAFAGIGVGTLDFTALREAISDKVAEAMNTIGAGTSGFDLDLSAAISTMQINIAAFAGQVAAAFQTGGWTGLGALAIEKIGVIGESISTAFDGLTLDMSSVGAWAKRQADAAKAQLDAIFGEGNLGSQLIERMTGTVSRISEALAGIGDMTVAEQFNAGVVSILEVFGLIKGINLDVVTAASTALTSLATSILDFSNTLVSGLDVGVLAKMLGGVATEISGAIEKVADPENLSKLGESVGSLGATLATKIGEFFGTEKFGEDLGTAIGGATVALALGANALVEGIAGQLAGADWTKINAQTDAFARTLVQSILDSIWAAMKEADVFGTAPDWVVALADSLGILEKFQENPLLAGVVGGGKLPTPSPAEAMRLLNPTAEMTAIITEATPAAGLQPLPLLGEIGKVTTPNAIPLPPLQLEIDPVIAPISKQMIGPLPQVEIEPVWPKGLAAFMALDPVEVPIIPKIDVNVPDFMKSLTPAGAIPVDAQVDKVLPPMGPMPKIEVEASSSWGTTMTELAAQLSGALSSAVEEAKGRFGLQSMQPPEDMAAAQPAFVWPPYPEFIWPKLPEFPKFSWPALTKFEWPALPEWMWPDMPKFDWPALPTWTWPALPIFDWPEYPRWTWPSIPQPGWIWPEIPMPGWVSLLLGGPSTSTGAAPAAPAAAGGAMSTKGAYWVGEAGPELVLPSRGSRILTNGESMALAGAGAGGVTVNLGPVTVQSPLDYEEIAYRVLEVLKRKG